MKYKLKDIGKITTGKTPSKSIKNAFGGNMNFLTPTDFNGKRYSDSTVRSLSDNGVEAVSNYVVKYPSISVTCIGSDMGKTILNRTNIVSNQQINSISEIIDDINPKYLYYLLTAKRKYLHFLGSGQGSTMPILNKRDFGNIEFFFPEKEQQDSIVKILDVLDKKIELNKAINDNLMKLNTLLFQQLSVDSDYTLSNFTDCQNGFAFKSSEYITNNELLILRTLNMTSDHLFSKNGVKYISKVYKEKYQKFEFKKFDTTLVMVGASIGKMALITTNVIPSLQNQNMWRFRSKSKMPGLLIYDMVQYVNDRVRSSATGSARSFYRKKMFLNSKVPVISEKYYDVFLAIQEKINNIANENETLSNLKNVLLSKYF